MNSIITIDLSAISHNLSMIKSLLPQHEICAVIKANAYGHGAVKVAQTLLGNGVRWFAVTNISEAILLKEANLDKSNILIFSSTVLENIEQILSLELIPTIYSLEVLQSLTGLLNGREIKCHIEIDTGMTRTGIDPKDLIKVIAVLKSNNNIKPTGLYSHLVDAETPDDKIYSLQLQQLTLAKKAFENKGIILPFIHLSNSAGIITRKNFNHINMVRPGIMLYGVNPSAKNITLKHAMSWHSKVLQIHLIKKGQGVSYNHTWKAKKNSRIATIPVGYADGYPRQATNKGYVIINDQKAPFVGNICMDFMMVDITECENITIGDSVILMGSSKSLNITSNLIAKWANTIAYDILCSAGKRSSISHK